MADRSQDHEIIKSFIKAVRDGCRIPVQKHPPVLPIVYNMSDEEISGLHGLGDCYVCSSRAEGWGIPAFDALGHGKTLISNTYGGLGSFVNKENSIVYGGMTTLFFDIKHQDPGLFTGMEQCFEPSPAEMAACMRRFHTLNKASKTNSLTEKDKLEWGAINTMRKNGKITTKAFDYRAMAPQIEKVIDHIYSEFLKNKAGA
jgi:glycogen synthase